MADLSSESVAGSNGNPPSLASPVPEPIPLEQSPKLKGRKKILHGLHRISSAQSLLKITRPPVSGYRGTGKGSISCISLSSPSTSAYDYPIGNSCSNQLSNGYSTAPTSIPGTPGFDNAVGDPSARVRVIASNTPAWNRPKTPGSVPMPQDFRQASSRPVTSAGAQCLPEDYFSSHSAQSKPRLRRPDFDFWREMPVELKMNILQQLKPKEIVRCSRVSKSWHKMCFDGQLWANLDTADFYRDIPADTLVKIITTAGPFARDLNLRGCVQLSDHWRTMRLPRACNNLEYISLEGCKIDLDSIHGLLKHNERLVHVNFSGLHNVNNATMKILAKHCPRLELLNVSWCPQVETRGLRCIVERCPRLRDLRAGEIRGFNDVNFMNELFRRNTLERLVLMNCDSLTQESFSALVEGINSERDYLTGRAVVPPRKLKHLDLSRCRNIADTGVISLAHHVPYLEGLQLSKCQAVTDDSLVQLFPTVPRLSHLDLEELDLLTNASLIELSKSPCKGTLQHLSISYCENLGDVGMLPVIKECTSLRSLELDNTRISDLVLIEAASMVRQRFVSTRMSRAFTVPPATGPINATTLPNGLAPPRPKIGLRMVVYDCQNVTWTGIREVLSRNAEIRRPQAAFCLPSSHHHHHHHQQQQQQQASGGLPAPIETRNPNGTAPPSHELFAPPPSPDLRHIRLAATADPSTTAALPAHLRPRTPQGPSHPHHIIALKVFYGYQPTVAEHTRRVLRADYAAASRLERKWAEYMVASEEAGAPGGFGPAGFGVVGAFAGLGGFGGRRRRRRVRETMVGYADEEEGGGEGSGGWFGGGGGSSAGAGVGGRRRRARSGGGCAVM